MPLLIAGVPLEIVALVPVPFVALFLGWLPHNDLAYDSTAVWMHIASGVRGVVRPHRPARAGAAHRPAAARGRDSDRDLAATAAGRSCRRWSGVCVSLFLCGLGLSSIASVVGAVRRLAAGREPVPAAAAHRRRAARSPRASVMLGTIVAERAGAVVGVARAHRRHRGGDARAVGRARRSGVGVLVVGIAIGLVVFERRGGRLMEFAEST